MAQTEVTLYAKIGDIQGLSQAKEVETRINGKVKH